ncbi:hypothetical protein POM88_020387 [Heracleum sosnowskyi]|uniref:Uncharacterized protein n=1 Tax=Heracleum sosnowskyi TaxID=360622 RepID=A0AAD8MRT9_9APIA|nr:hypothetical protein POM88_020387 [Heracleum sosnowskyi]
MGRPPSKMGEVNKKGSWTPEEDLLLLSYVQENGPGDWKSVPKNTGLQRCSRSCRLRWKNYLRPDIKRGHFTAEEDKKIINLQALFGNKWAAIAHYLPDRTDNDIKNHWNIRLKKTVNGAISGDDGQGSNNTSTTQFNQDIDSSKDIWLSRLQNNVHTAKKALFDAISISQTTSIRYHGAVTPPTSLTSSSSSLMAIPPLQTSGLSSLNSPPKRNMNADEQDLLNNPDDYHLRIHELAPVNQGSNYSTTSHPSSEESIMQWLQRWTKEYPNKESAMRNITDSMEINPSINHDQGMMNGDGDNAMIPLFTSTENYVLHYEANYVSPVDVVDVVADHSLSANIQDKQHEENNDLQMLNMSKLYDQNVFWPFN